MIHSCASTELWDLLDSETSTNTSGEESSECVLQHNLLSAEVSEITFDDESIENFLDVGQPNDEVHVKVCGKKKTLEVQDDSNKSQSKAQEKDVRRKEYVAAAMRKSRAKRKREQERLRLRSLELEQEQTKFKLTIASLQNEIEALKNCQKEFGYIDLRTENRLLRAELKRHKTFIQAIKGLSAGLPEYTKEEKLRIAKTGADSLVGNILGLYYTSVAEGNSWQSTKIPIYDNVYLDVKYQYLPHGASWAEAKRINARFDFHGNSTLLGEKVDLDSSDFKKNLWTQYSADNPMKKLFRSLFQVEVEWDEIDFKDDITDTSHSYFIDTRDTDNIYQDSSALWKDENMRIKLFSYKEKSLKNHFEQPLDSVVLVVSSDEMVNSAGFSKFDTGSDQDKNMIKANVFGSTFAIQDQSSIELHPIQPGIKRIGCSFYEGYVIRENEEGNDVTFIFSFPIDSNSFEFCRPEFVHVVNEDGTPNENMVKCTRMYYEQMFLPQLR